MGTQKSKGTNEHAKHKLRLNMHTKNTLGPTGLFELVLVSGHCAHGKLPMYSVNARDHFNCSPLLFSKQMRPNGRGGGKY